MQTELSVEYNGITIKEQGYSELWDKIIQIKYCYAYHEFPSGVHYYLQAAGRGIALLTSVSKG